MTDLFSDPLTVLSKFPTFNLAPHDHQLEIRVAQTEVKNPGFRHREVLTYTIHVCQMYSFLVLGSPKYLLLPGLQMKLTIPPILP